MCDRCDRIRAAMWQKFRQWAGHPFSVDMTATEWFLFIGLLLVIIALWNIILSHLVTIIRDSNE